MKKLYFLLATIALVLALSSDLEMALAETDTSGWYQYNGYSSSHSFAVKFPSNWEVTTKGDDLQKIGPSDEDQTYFSITEFEGNTYAQAINYFAKEDATLIDTYDELFSANSDLLVKTAVYQNEEGQFGIDFIKRGGLIVAITKPNFDETSFPIPSKYNETVSAIHDSFSFTDNWHQYIDFQDGYTFAFPRSLKISHTSTGVILYEPEQSDDPVFEVKKYANTTPMNAANSIVTDNERLMESNSLFFHGLENVIRVTYLDVDEGQEFNRIFLQNNQNVYEITDVNIEDDFPHLSYWDQYVSEILESFELFTIESDVYGYLYFPDVREDHPNEKAIDSLTAEGTISGYPDGTFRPDGEINRAELTKLVVESRTTPRVDNYKECFTDVEKEWFAPYVCYAKDKGWVQGYEDETFKPEQSVTRVEAIKIIFEVLASDMSTSLKKSTYSDIEAGTWYTPYFLFAEANNLLDTQHIEKNDSTKEYLPSSNMTRKEVAETIYRVQKLD